VVYNGVNELFAPISEVKQEEVKQQYTNGNPFFIYVGSLNPRKNIENTLRAFNEFKKQSKSTHQLLIVGEKLWSNQSIEDCYHSLEYKNDIQFTGRLFNEALSNLLGASVALLYVSFFEGFGIPVIEAMQCGTAVITSDRSSLPEVAGNAAIQCNPEDVEEIANQMASLLDETNRVELITKGFEQVKQFSWDKAAKELWEAVEKII